MSIHLQVNDLAIEAKIAQLEAQLLDTERSLLQSKAENAALSKQLADLTKAKAEADKQLLSLQSLLKQANDEIERLKKLLADMTAAKNAGDARISTLEGQVKDDANKISSLNKQVDAMETQAKKDSEEINANRLRIAELEGAILSFSNPDVALLYPNDIWLSTLCPLIALILCYSTDYSVL